MSCLGLVKHNCCHNIVKEAKFTMPVTKMSESADVREAALSVLCLSGGARPTEILIATADLHMGQIYMKSRKY